MNFVDEILGSDGFIVLADVDWPSNVQSILNECWSDGDHPLKRLRTTLGMVNLFGIACICGKIRLKIRIAQTPTRCKVKPAIVCRERNYMSRAGIWYIKQIRVFHMNALEPPV